MGFAQEMRDFTAAFDTTSRFGDRLSARRLNEQRFGKPPEERIEGPSVFDDPAPTIPEKKSGSKPDTQPEVVEEPDGTIKGGSGDDTLIGGAGVDPVTTGSTQVTASPYSNAIASIESGGNYRAVGPVTKGDRPYGKHQVMGANIGPWTKDVLGQSLTPSQWLNSPAAQEKVFEAKFGEYVKQFGPEGAAQAWIGGPGSVGKTGRKDVLGTSVGSYGKRFMAALGKDAAAGAGAGAGAGMGGEAAMIAAGPAISDDRFDDDDEDEQPIPTESGGGGGGTEAAGSAIEMLPGIEVIDTSVGDAPQVATAWLDDEEQNFAEGGVIPEKRFAKAGKVDQYNPNRDFTQALPKPGATSHSRDFVPRRIGSSGSDAFNYSGPTPSQLAWRDIMKKRDAPKPVSPPPPPPAAPTSGKYSLQLSPNWTGRQGGRSGDMYRVTLPENWKPGSTFDDWNSLPADVRGAVQRGHIRIVPLQPGLEPPPESGPIRQRVQFPTGPTYYHAEGGVIPEVSYANGGQVRESWHAGASTAPGLTLVDPGTYSAAKDKSLFTRPKAKKVKTKQGGKKAEDAPKPKPRPDDEGAPEEGEGDAGTPPVTEGGGYNPPPPPDARPDREGYGVVPENVGAGPSVPQEKPPSNKRGGTGEPGWGDEAIQDLSTWLSDVFGAQPPQEAGRGNPPPVVQKPQQAPRPEPSGPSISDELSSIFGAQPPQPGRATPDPNQVQKPQQAARPAAAVPVIPMPEYSQREERVDPLTGRAATTDAPPPPVTIGNPPPPPPAEQPRMDHASAFRAAQKALASGIDPKEVGAALTDVGISQELWPLEIQNKVLGFAEGGAIPEPERNHEPGYTTSQSYRPPTGEPSNDNQPDMEPTPELMGKVGDAIRGGLSYLNQHFTAGQQGALPMPEDGANQQRQAQAFAKGEGASTPDEISGVDDVIDPQRELREGDRQLARLANMVDWYNEQGRPKDAAAAAASLLQYGGVRFQRLGGMAGEAYKDYLAGDQEALDKTLSYISQAMQMVPDGTQVDFAVDRGKGRIVGTRTTSDGKSEEFEVTPEQIPQLLKNMMDKSAYWKQVFRIADPAGAHQQAGFEESERVRQDNRRYEEGREEFKYKRERGDKAADRETAFEDFQRRRDYEVANPFPERGQEGKEVDWATVSPLRGAVNEAAKALGEDKDNPELLAAYDAAVSRLFDALPPNVNRDEYMKDMGIDPGWTYVPASGAAGAEAPPVAGAEKAPDGKWYVRKPDGGYQEVRPKAAAAGG